MRKENHTVVYILVVTGGLLLLTLMFGPFERIQAQGALPAFSTSFPYRSLSKTRQIINTIALKIILLLDYTEPTTWEGTWKTTGITGVEVARHFVKHMEHDIDRTIELAALPSPRGSYELYVYGLEVSPNSQRPNPDLPGIQSSIQSLVQTIQTEQQSPNVQKLGYEIYHLSYLQSDRAIALLKALGYTTIEYTQQDGETLYDKIYTPTKSAEWHLPVIVKLIDAGKTSLMDPSPVGTTQQRGYGQTGYGQMGYGQTQTVVPDIGGTFLHHMTEGDPQERLLIVHDEDDPESLEALLNILREKIDLPARQIVIEALVIEINTNRMKDLGVTFRGTKGDYDISFEESDKGEQLPFTFVFDRNAFSDVLTFRNTLKAMVESGDAEILSNPSVLVLDDRQARIQVGQQVPVVKSTATAAGITSSVEYFPVGIVLNLRPHISEEGSEVTMQVETIVSAISRAVGTPTEASQVFFAPTVDNRQVQTFVRVADNTPFIIGGLISTDKQERTTGVPLLSSIPFLGFLFRHRVSDNVKKEVIVVLTPHTAPLQEKSFSYVIPKDSDIFDSFGNRLFRNAYRIRDTDVFDLKFIYESDIFQSLLSRIHKRIEEKSDLKTDPLVTPLLDGGVPGEEILVRRMLWEIVRKTDYKRYIDINRIIFFESQPDAPDSTGFQLAYLSKKLAALDESRNTLVLTFEAHPEGTTEHPFVQPTAVVTYEHLTPETYNRRLMEGNRHTPDGTPDKWTILLTETPLSTVHPIELLKGVLVLKRLLALNSTLPLAIREFHVGRQIIFPMEQDLQTRFHVIDRDAARFFYEVYLYYPAFEQEFNRQTRRITKLLEESNR